MPFYDLNRQMFDCPNCGSDFDLETDIARNGKFTFGSTLPPQWKRWSKPAKAAVAIVQDEVESGTEEPATEADTEADTETDDAETDLSSDNLLDEDVDEGSSFAIRPGNLDKDSKG